MQHLRQRGLSKVDLLGILEHFFFIEVQKNKDKTQNPGRPKSQKGPMSLAKKTKNVSLNGKVTESMSTEKELQSYSAIN